MKICFIMPTVFNLGGIQRVVSVLASGLVANHDVTILCTNGEYQINRELYNLNQEVKVIINEEIYKKKFLIKVYSKLLRTLNTKIRFLNKKKFLKLLTEIYYPTEVQKKFISYLNSKEYDVIIGTGGEYSLLLGVIADKLKAKTIGWQHNSYEAYFNTPYKYNWNQGELFKAYIKKIDKYIVLTDEDKKLIDKNFMINSNRIYNPLSFTSDKKSTCSEKNILFIGRLEEQQKGLDLLVQAFNKVCLKNRDWILTIVGDGSDKEKLEQQIDDLNLAERIKIESSTNNIKQYYLNSSIFVSSSRWEGFGLVITEAMECGLPVVAFANSGPREIINKNYENGILVSCEDVDSLANSILDLINNDEKRKQISKLAIERAKDFSCNKIVDEWQVILNNINSR